MPWRGQACAVAAEFFATTGDAYVVLGELDEQPTAAWTADGRPPTAQFARARLARMLCADTNVFDEAAARQAAEFVRDAQVGLLRNAIQQVVTASAKPNYFILCGAGEFLARALVQKAWPETPTVSIAERLGHEVSMCAPAHALAVLAREMGAA
jgi:uncharacterized hydantoinase/oxoprolinase family protein